MRNSDFRGCHCNRSRLYLTISRNILIFHNSFSELESKHEFVVKVRDVVRSWPRSVFIVMRYLFAFLNHLSEFR